MAYDAEISRANPSCFLFLIDQSGSMIEPFGGDSTRSKAERLADAINRLLDDLVTRCTKQLDQGPWNYYDIGVVGYGNSQFPNAVGPALAGALAGQALVSVSDLAANARIETRDRMTEDGAGGLVKESIKFSVWFDATADDGTPMREALSFARQILESWTESHPSSFPPIVIHITDGEAPDPRRAADALTSLSTDDGNVLLFNVHISARAGAPILYPPDSSGLPDEHSKQLFDMSSVLPPHIQVAAAAEGYSVSPQSRGFVFNADIVEVIRFLNIGTRPRYDLR